MGHERIPLDGRQSKAQAAPAKVSCLIIVRRDQPDLCDYLRERTEEKEVRVLLDRRRVPSCETEPFEGERRRPLSKENDLRYRQYLIVRPHPEALQG
jgi:hypothetical protein